MLSPHRWSIPLTITYHNLTKKSDIPSSINYSMIERKKYSSTGGYDGHKMSNRAIGAYGK